MCHRITTRLSVSAFYSLCLYFSTFLLLPGSCMGMERSDGETDIRSFADVISYTTTCILLRAVLSLMSKVLTVRAHVCAALHISVFQRLPIRHQAYGLRLLSSCCIVYLFKFAIVKVIPGVHKVETFGLESDISPGFSRTS